MRLKLEKTSGCSMKIYRCAAKPLFYGVRGPAHFQISHKSQPFVPRASYHRDAALALVMVGADWTCNGFAPVTDLIMLPVL
jgi:hypothetical protein